jgi:hypothetical protein
MLAFKVNKTSFLAPLLKRCSANAILFKFSTFSGSLKGLPDFSRYNLPKREKYAKSPQYVPNVHRIYQMSLKFTIWP